jgi:hypothetical protein
MFWLTPIYSLKAGVDKGQKSLFPWNRLAVLHVGDKFFDGLFLQRSRRGDFECNEVLGWDSLPDTFRVLVMQGNVELDRDIEVLV